MLALVSGAVFDAPALRRMAPYLADAHCLLGTATWRDFSGRTQGDGFDSAVLHRAQGAANRRLHQGLPRLRGLVPADDRLWQPGALYRAWGVESAGHAFHGAPVAWGFDLTEPQITKGFSHFLSPASFGQMGRVRACAFLTALCEVAGQNALAARLETLPPETRVTVKPERSTSDQNGGKRAMDLFFTVQDRTASLAFVVEFKLGHVVTPGQLDSYRDHVLHCQKFAHEDTGFFVVGQRYSAKDQKADNDNEDWAFVNWSHVLKRFERKLSQSCPDDNEAEFMRFRRTAWARCAEI